MLEIQTDRDITQAERERERGNRSVKRRSCCGGLVEKVSEGKAKVGRRMGETK